MSKQILLYATLIVIVFFITGCLAGPNTAVDIPDAEGALAGFWLGLWHGVIAPVTFVISLLSDNIHMYEIHNTGGWYDFGFVLGAGIIFGGSHKARRRKR